MAISSWAQPSRHAVVGPVLRRHGLPRAAREALHLRADTFAFIADPELKAADVKYGRELWAERGGVPPLAVIVVRGDADRLLAEAVAGVQAAIAAGAVSAVVEQAVTAQPDRSPRPGQPVGRDLVTAIAEQAPGLPLLYTVNADDIDGGDVAAWLAKAPPDVGWRLDVGALFAHGWWQPQRLAQLGQQLSALERPGAIWVREPQTIDPAAESAALGLGAMGLNLWWDVLAQPWTTDVPIYLEAPGRGTTFGAELHSLRRLIEMARGA